MRAKGIRAQFWTLEQYERLAYHAMNYPRYYYAYEILYWCGLRGGELLTLTLNDIDFDDGTISITKTYWSYVKIHDCPFNFMDGYADKFVMEYDSPEYEVVAILLATAIDLINT